jgi:hypothetical protein
LKALMYVEDRDNGFIVLDVTSQPDDDKGHPVEFKLAPDVTLQHVVCEDETDITWLQTDKPGEMTLIEVTHEQPDFDNATRFPIPSCIDEEG